MANKELIYMDDARRAILKINPDIVFCLDGLRRVNATPVVHGRWEDMYGGKYANPRYRCSACKEKSLYEFGRDALGNWRDRQALTPFCPNCGAKMDGDGNG